MRELYDAVVVGGGPAGLTAALYLARARRRVLVLEKQSFGGQLATTDEVVNYPGVASSSGAALTDTMRSQAERFGAEFQLAEATGFDLSGEVKTVRTAQGEIRALGVLLAMGAHPRRVGFAGEDAFHGRGVAVCATCDGEFFTGRDVYVVGGGYAAAEESVYLTRFARHVTVLIRRDGFSCAAGVAEPALRHEKITVLPRTVLLEVGGEGRVTYLKYKNTVTEKVTEVNDAEGLGVFLFAGYEPETKLLRGTLAQDEQGYLLVDAQGKTALDGVYAAGDVCARTLRQAVAAAGSGAAAATALEKHLAAVQEKNGLRAQFPDTQAPETPKTPEAPAPNGDLFTAEQRRELQALFSRMTQPLMLRLTLDGREISHELKSFITQLAALSDKLTVDETDGDGAPCVSVCRADGTEAGLFFHGVPSGHEFTSFVLGLYHAASPDQVADDNTKRRIAALTQKTELTLLVTLSCTMCPALAAAAQQLAALNPHVSTHVYDIHHFPQLRERYHAMSVPCLVVNGTQVHFGRKNLDELLTLLGV